MNTTETNDPMGVLTGVLEEWPIYSLAAAARLDWKTLHAGKDPALMGMDAHPAYPYYQAMLHLEDVNDPYGQDDGRAVVWYFLSNATGWRGPIAKAVKAELKRRLG